MGFFKDFKSFLMKGDIIALATAVIIGGAFNKIVGSLAQDIIMPFIGLFMGGQNVNNMFIALDGSNHETLAAAKAADAAIMTYGNFLQTIINFIVIGFVIFMILRSYEKTKKKEKEAPAAPKGPTQEEILLEIRDELKKQNS
ncbi:large conductance mechanosensitive channel protein MscL [Aquimarina intermedia]|uniref:Large-conductance mechanosensitive channel n=1 Tax=Aquimarina intermedia TaxID=350814 RepID=A0A5S5CCE8_9FLAO|nr:large conductance mechanosensitive channel protein MscL [Aquimarina intermedia]TYP77017.1 large conductance mechanosensitive channel [Aquimarina intermedia]